MKRLPLFLLFLSSLALWNLSGCKKTPPFPSKPGKVFKGTLMVRSLTDLHPFADSGYNVLDGNLIIDHVSGLKDLSAFSQLKTITGFVSISNNPDLVSLHGLEKLRTIGHGLDIFQNNRLQNTDALNGLNQVHDISIYSNNGLTTIRLAGITQLNRLDLSNNYQLKTIFGPEHLESLESLVITLDTVLTEVTGFQQLKTIRKNLFFNLNFAVRNINWTSYLEEVGGWVSISDNPFLTDLNGLKNLKKVGGKFILSRNASLSNINGLAQLQNVGTDFSISDNPLLSDINGLTRLRYVGRNFEISFNANLENLKGLASLYEVGNTFQIFQNNKINRLDGLQNLHSVEKLEILHNENLFNYCSLKGLLIEGTVDTLSIEYNGTDPTREEIIKQPCGK